LGFAAKRILSDGFALRPRQSTPVEVIDRLGMMPIPGMYQCMIPLYNDMWVQPVPKGTAD
jgi:hypothetical protein